MKSNRKSELSEALANLPMKKVLAQLGVWKETQTPSGKPDITHLIYEKEVNGDVIEVHVLADKSGNESGGVQIILNGLMVGFSTRTDAILDLLFDGKYYQAENWAKSRTTASQPLLRRVAEEIRASGEAKVSTNNNVWLEARVHEKFEELKVLELARKKQTEEKFDSGQPSPEPVNLSIWLKEPDIEISFRIEELWPSGGNVMLIAQHKAGKTTTAIHLCKCLADGTDFLGRFAVQRVESKLGYMNFELSPRQFKSWLKKAKIKNPECILVWNLKGEPNPLASELSRARFAQELADAKVEVLIIDPFSSAFRNGDSNSNDEVKAFLLNLDELVKQSGIKELLLIAHAGHEGNRARGASTLGDHPDALWYISKAENSSQRLFRAEGRDVFVEEESLTLKSDGITLTLSGLSRTEVSLSDTMEKILRFVLANPNCNSSQLESGVGGSKSRFSSARKKLIENGDLIETLSSSAKQYRVK